MCAMSGSAVSRWVGLNAAPQYDGWQMRVPVYQDVVEHGSPSEVQLRRMQSRWNLRLEPVVGPQTSAADVKS